MEQMPKVFLGVFFLLLLVFGGISITTASIDSADAEEFTADAAMIIGEHNFSPTVIEELQELAKERDYILTVNLSDLDGDGTSDIGEVLLEYHYSISLVDYVTTNHYARAYAR